MLAALDRQIDRLVSDLPVIAAQLVPQRGPAAELLRGFTALAVGSGDSLFAAEAAQLAWRRLTGSELDLRSPMALQFQPPGPHHRIVAISASGRSPATVLALKRAGGPGLAISCTAGSDLTEAAELALCVALPDAEPGPGLRTYQASVMTLFALAGAIGAQTRAATDTLDLEGALAGIGSALGETIAITRQAAARISHPIAKTGSAAVLGSGPHLGTARFTAAKLTEIAGISAIGQDIEEWWHVERFQAVKTTPLIIFAPNGPSQARAIEVALGARLLGHIVTLIGAPDLAKELSSASFDHVPIGAGPAEPWAAVTMAPIGPIIAGEVARLLDRTPFQFGRAENPQP